MFGALLKSNQMPNGLFQSIFQYFVISLDLLRKVLFWPGDSFLAVPSILYFQIACAIIVCSIWIDNSNENNNNKNAKQKSTCNVHLGDLLVNKATENLLVNLNSFTWRRWQQQRRLRRRRRRRSRLETVYATRISTQNPCTFCRLYGLYYSSVM